MQLIWRQLLQFYLRVANKWELLELLAIGKMRWMVVAIMLAACNSHSPTSAGVDPSVGSSVESTLASEPSKADHDLVVTVPLADPSENLQTTVYDSPILLGNTFEISTPRDLPLSGHVITFTGFFDNHYVQIEEGGPSFAAEISDSIGSLARSDYGGVEFLKSVRVDGATLIWIGEDRSMIIATDHDSVDDVASGLAGLISRATELDWDKRLTVDLGPKLTVRLGDMGLLFLKGESASDCGESTVALPDRHGATWDLARYSWQDNGAGITAIPSWSIVDEAHFEAAISVVRACFREG